MKAGDSTGAPRLTAKCFASSIAPLASPPAPSVRLAWPGQQRPGWESSRYMGRRGRPPWEPRQRHGGHPTAAGNNSGPLTLLTSTPQSPLLISGQPCLLLLKKHPLACRPGWRIFPGSLLVLFLQVITSNYPPTPHAVTWGKRQNALVGPQAPPYVAMRDSLCHHSLPLSSHL